MQRPLEPLRLVFLVAGLFWLAACARQEPAPETPRPVLVVQAGAGADAAVSAFAGEIRARNESPVAFRVGGNIAKRNVEVGDRVTRGQVLAELDGGDQQLQAAAAQAQLAAAEAQLTQANAELARLRPLASQQLVSKSSLDAAIAAQAAASGQVRAARAQRDVMRNQSDYTHLRAPRDGVIASRSAEAGQTVAAGQPIFVLAGDAGREVAIALPEAGIRDFAVGQPVLVELWSGDGERLPGRIREIAPAADPQARTYAARVLLESDAADAVELGQSARVYVQARGATGALELPLSALQRNESGSTAVWVVDPATHALRLVAVTVGAYGSDKVPVTGGLRGGEWVVAAGGHLLREGQKVAPVDRDNRPVEPAAPKAR